MEEKVEVIHTPGHTMTHVVYHFPELRALFTGDSCGTASTHLTGCIFCFE